MNYDDLWAVHRKMWTHCVRCSLCEHRVHEEGLPYRIAHASDIFGDELSNQRPRPRLLHILYPCPDPQQFEASNFWAGQTSKGTPRSSAHWLLWWSLEVFRLANYLPPDLDPEELSVSFALGCRPVNFKNPRRIMKPKREFMKMCEPRWQTEILAADPELVLICGVHALAAVRPDLQSRYHGYIGEVVPFSIELNSGTAEFEGYVTHSPEEIVTIARRDHYVLENWEPKPIRGYTADPVKSWLWHLIWALWLAHAARHQIEDFPGHKDFEALSQSLNDSFERRTTIQDLAANAERIRRTEASLGVRFSLTHDEEDDND